ncbi:MAG: FHA domain-containing protein, partial [bacterium]|nr:FHA domain-containing protein [bacterium]
MTYIIVRRGPEPGRVYPVEKDQVRLGRGSRNDIIIHDNDVYREHLLLVNTQEGYELHDLTTDHSTSVNGQVVDGVWLLQSNCIIELGDAITLEYRLGDPADEVATAEVPTAALEGESQNQAYLIVTLNSQPEPAVYPLEGAVVKVGRGQTNDVIIVEPEMSREHFRLTLTQRGYAIEDLNSTNGTMVNGDILSEPTLLRHGDLIQIGTMVQIQYTGSPESYTSKMKVDTTPLPLNSPTV